MANARSVALRILLKIEQEQAYSNLALANAIRGKTGSTNKLSLDGMVEEIGKIKGGFPNGTEWTRSNVNGGFDRVYYANGIWVAGSRWGDGNNKGLYYFRRTYHE